MASQPRSSRRRHRMSFTARAQRPRGTIDHAAGLDRAAVRLPRRLFDADRLRARHRGDPGSRARRLLARNARFEPDRRVAELDLAGDPELYLRRYRYGTLRHVERAGRSGARAGRLAARRPRHVGDRRVVLFLRYLRLEDGRGVGARLDLDAALTARRLPPGRWRLADRFR